MKKKHRKFLAVEANYDKDFWKAQYQNIIMENLKAA